MDCVVETQERISSLKADINSLYEPVASVKEEKSLGQQQFVNKVINLDKSSQVKKSRRVQNVYNCNGSYVIQSDSCINVKSLHSVNAFNNLQNGSIVVKSSSEERLGDHPMDMNFENGEIHKNSIYDTALNSTSVYLDQSNGFMPPINGHPIEYTSYNGQGKNETQQFVLFQNDLEFPVVDAAASVVQSDEHIDFAEEQILRKRLSDPLNLRMYEDTSNLSLSRNSSYPLSDVSDLSDPIDSSVNSYQENGSFSNCYLPKTGSDYVNGAHATAYSDLDVLDSKTFSSNPYKLTFPMTASSVDSPSRYTQNSFNAMDTSTEISEVNRIPEQNFGEKMEFPISDFTRTPSVKSSFADRNGTSEAYSHTFAANVPVGNWTGDFSEPVASLDVSLNKELYEKLDMFFQNLPQSNTSQNSNFGEQVSEFPVNSSISSSDAKRTHRH